MTVSAAQPSAPATGPTPAQSEAFARTTGRVNVTDYLPRASHDGAAAPGKCEWTSHVAASLTPDETGALAWLLIDTIMLARCGPATHIYDAWRSSTLSGTQLGLVTIREVVSSFVEPVFGRPGHPKSADHLQGHVGEWLWHLLTRDNAAVRVQPDPKGDVTDAGGDGYSIYESLAGELRFRLWESKKNTGSGSLSTSLNDAYEQLSVAGQRYVAKLVGTFSQGSNGSAEDLMVFITEVPEAWAQGDDLVGAGVNLATHQALPAAPFLNMATHLPRLNKPGQLRGLATSISCYVDLAETVRRYAWTAL